MDLPIAPRIYHNKRMRDRRLVWLILCLLAWRASIASARQPPSDDDKPPLEQVTDDGRWNQTDLGRYLASIIALPEGPVHKGLSICVGDGADATVCYDTKRLALRAVWAGGFLKFDPTRFGIINSPGIEGTLVYSSAERPGWQADELRYLGMYVNGDRVVLSYKVDGIDVLESPWASGAVRGPEVGPSLKLNQSDSAKEGEPDSQGKAPLGEGGLLVTRTFAIEPHENPLVLNATGTPRGRITISPAEDRRELEVIYTFDASAQDRMQPQAELSDKPSVNVRALTRGGPSRWPQQVVTVGEVGDNDAAYVIDKIALPHENPYNALMFASGHGFFSGDRRQEAGDGGQSPEVGGQRLGQPPIANNQDPTPGQQPTANRQPPAPDMAVCTLHGEVWTVGGVDEDLDRLVWRRFATGLFQPLGMVVVDDVVHVLGRDRITRLHDTNGDGAADWYENFCSDYETSAHGHDFVTSLERDAAGNFYFAHAVTGVMRVSPDGARCESLAAGLRNPNGLGASPGGFVTVAPQQGNWTPSSCIFWVRPGDWYGYQGLRVTPDRPLGYDVPLCWIPHAQDSSSGGQVWVTSDRWGPLAGEMLHLSYGQCSMMLTLRERVGEAWQGGNVDFPLLFDSGVMRGRFSPRDGQLYVSGLRGWQNRAVLDGCLARVRYTGRPVDMPVALRTMQNGLAVTFTRPLEQDAAETVGNYAIERWNYRFTKNYGSPDLRVSAPGVEGRDDVSIRSATLLDDGRTVFLEIPDMRPANQYLVRYALRAADGAPIEHEFSYTIHVVGPDRMDEASLHRMAPKNALTPEVAENLRQGLILRFRQAGVNSLAAEANGKSDSVDARRARMAAWHIPAGVPPTPRLFAGPFAMTAEGYLQIRQPGHYRLSLSGSGTATLRIDGKQVIQTRLTHQRGEQAEVRLGAGHHRVEIRHESPLGDDTALRLWWSSDAFGREPVPPDVLRHDARDEELIASERHYLGRELFASHHCADCHAIGSKAMRQAAIDDVSVPDAPDLRGASERLKQDWIAAWIEDPAALRSDATMPALLHGRSEQERKQHAADLAAFVCSLAAAREAEPRDSAPAGEARKREIAALADQGEILYEQLACLACHRLTPPTEADEHDRVSLHFAAAKFRPGGLVEYLRKPNRHHRSTRMPDFRLTVEEASTLAAYLLRETSGHSANPSPRDGEANHGRRLYASLGCANCHPVGNVESARAPGLAFATTEKALGGCLAATAAVRDDAPAFHLTTEEREAIAIFLRSDGRSFGQTTPLESAARLVRQLRCTACHDRDGGFAPRTAIVYDEGITGLAPEPVPSLTWTGEKLRREWIEAFLAGRLDSPRPWLKARMPRYAYYAEALAHALPAEHGLARKSRTDALPPAEGLVEAGRQLTLQTALDCRQCHGIGSTAPRGDDRTLNAQGINFAETRLRVTHEFFLRLLRDPVRVDPATKMPKLAEAGRTNVTQHFSGDAEKQFEAIWAYIQSLDPADSSTPASSLPGRGR